MSTGSFVFLFALFLLHEMDAIRAKEWKMFIILKDIKEEAAYLVFSAVHLPLYLLLLYLLLKAEGDFTFYLIADILFIVHTLVHICFRKHPDNGFGSVYSKTILYGMGIIALLHMAVIFL